MVTIEDLANIYASTIPDRVQSPDCRKMALDFKRLMDAADIPNYIYRGDRITHEDVDPLSYVIVVMSGRKMAKVFDFTQNNPFVGSVRATNAEVTMFLDKYAGNNYDWKQTEY